MSGIFRFKFWQYGEWVEVVIDDYLPTHDGNLLFLKSDTHEEYWTALIEKAYAKLYGNYVSALSGGWISSAMEDLSGGVAESYRWGKAWNHFGSWETIKPTFQIMLRSYQKGSMMGAAILSKSAATAEPEPKPKPVATESNTIADLMKQKYETIKLKLEQENGKFEDPLFPRNMTSIGPINLSPRSRGPLPNFEKGLVDGHAYSITKVVELVTNGTVHQLVRVRNPWGNSMEWTGPWSDGSDEWKALSGQEKSDLGLLKEDDGEFFMPYDDFVKVTKIF